MRREAIGGFAIALVASAQPLFVPVALAGPHDALIAKHAAANGVPEELVHRVVRVESRGNAAAVYRGNYGLMQIRLATARGVGYSGDADGLLDPDTNLKYAVRYLAGAYRAAGCDAGRAVRYYQRGYHGTQQRDCGAAAPALMQLAQADTTADEKAGRTAARTKNVPTATEIKPPDVIKPKVVRTETIVTPKSGSAPTRPVGNFEPARIAPPVQPVAVTAPMPPARPEVAKPAAVEPAAKVELASVPLPRVRPELDSAPMPKAEPIPRAPRLEPANKKSTSDTKPSTEAKSKTQSKRAASKSNAKSKTEPPAKDDSIFKLEDPAGVVTFLKKLVTPDQR